jgi:hypothetical protein
MDDLSRVLDAHGGLDRWAGARTITAHLSIGGPIWAANGWAGALTEQTLTVDTRRERSVFTPFTAPDLRSVFEVGPERVTIDTSDCEVVQQRTHPRDAFTGFLRAPLGPAAPGLLHRLCELELPHHTVVAHLPRCHGPRDPAVARSGAAMEVVARHVPRDHRYAQPRTGLLL